MSNRKIKHEPPGFFIKKELDARGWSQADLAFVLDMQPQQLNSILSGKHSITTQLAVALEDALGMPAEFFSSLQTQYDLANASPGNPEIQKRAMWQAKYPLREMIARGWVEDAEADLIDAQMMRFLEVKRLSDVPHLGATAQSVAHEAKKTSVESSYKEATPEQLAWLHRVRHLARSMHVEAYAKERLLIVTNRLAALRTSPDDAVTACDMLASAGVRLVVVETLPGAKIDGVCTWLSDEKPVIGLSNRHDRLDNFWFVLRHEIEHVLRGHGQQAAIFDDDTTLTPDAVEIEEKQANDAAADFCVPRSQMASFIARKGNFVSEADIVGFSKRLAVHPAIVVGQYQFATKKWSFLRKYLSSAACGVRKHLTSALAGKNMIDGWGNVALVNL